MKQVVATQASPALQASSVEGDCARCGFFVAAALPHLFEERTLPRREATLKRRSNRSGKEQHQWAAAVVRKAMPRITESLIAAAASLGEGGQTSPSKPVRHGPDEVEDESLAALLLRLLRTPETGENSDAGSDVTTSARENPSVG